MSEEQRIASSLAELTALTAVIANWRRATRRPHPDEYKSIEDRVRQYFAKAIPEFITDTGFRTKRGSPNEQLDLVVNASDSLGITVLDGKSQILAHAEITYSDGNTWSDAQRKLNKDLSKLERTIRLAVDHGHCKPWIAQVLVGSGWEKHRNRIHSFLHHRYHASRKLRAVGPGGFWSLIDAVVLPGEALIKVELSRDQSLSASRFPAWAFFKTASDDPQCDFRSLSVARAHLRHAVLLARGLKHPESPAFEESEYSAVCGPPPNDQAYEWTEMGLRVMLAVTDQRPSVAYHRRNFAGTEWTSLVADSSALCTAARPLYYLLPRSSVVR